MSRSLSEDWNPETYSRFRGLRLRPLIDLMMQLGSLPVGEIVDLGCGDGAAAVPLAQRYPKHVLVGVDNSPAMLGQARGYDRLVTADAGTWTGEKPALIFSNAALQWLPDHATLMPRLARMLVPGGMLAVQMPRQYFAPSHRFLRDIAAGMFPDRFDFAEYEAPVLPVQGYWQMLSPLGEVHAWSSEYIQRLDPQAGMHPVQAFTQSTAMRPFVEKLNAAEEKAYRAAYDQALHSAYPLLPDGSALMPFTRVFFTLKV